MERILPARLAANIMIGLFGLTIIFHLLVIAGVVPWSIVGGGRIEDHDQMLVVETVAIAINLFMLWIVLMFAGLVKRIFSPKVLRILLWIMFVLFLLNTIGNLFAITAIERWVFTPITLLLAICSFRLASADPPVLLQDLRTTKNPFK